MARVIARVITRTCDEIVRHSRARHPEPPLPSRHLPHRPPHARARGGGGGGGSGGGTARARRLDDATRRRASSRVIAHACETPSCVTRTRVIPNPRLPFVISPIAPPPRARAAEAEAAAAAAAARRARVASMTRRDAARYRALLRTPVRRPRASLVRASSRTPACLSSSPVVPPRRPPRVRARGGGGGATVAACAHASPR